MKLKPQLPALPIHRRTRPERSRRKDGLRPERIRAHQRPGHPAGHGSTPAHKTASLSARDIKRFKRDGETWVRFYLATDNADDTPIGSPGAGSARSSATATSTPTRAKAYTARPVIELQVCMGKAIRTIEVNLTDRSAFQYPL